MIKHEIDNGPTAHLKIFVWKKVLNFNFSLRKIIQKKNIENKSDVNGAFDLSQWPRFWPQVAHIHLIPRNHQTQAFWPKIMMTMMT